MISEQQFKSQVRLLEGQLGLYRTRTTDLRDLLDEVKGALEHAQLSIVVDEVKRSTALAVHQIQRRLDDDTRRYSALDHS